MTLIRIVTPHGKVDDGYHEWINLEQRVRADRRGHRHPRVTYSEWTRWVCNNPECFGEAYVNDEYTRWGLNFLAPAPVQQPEKVPA